MPTHLAAPAGRLTVNVGITTTPLLSSDPERRSMVINPPSAGRLWFFPDPNLSAREGFSLNWDDEPLRLCCCDVGRLITGNWFGIIEAGDGPVTDRWSFRTSGTNAALSATQLAAENRRHQMEGSMAAYDVQTTVGRTGQEVNAVGVSSYNFTGTAPFAVLNRAIAGAANQPVGVTLTSGGVGVFGEISGWGVTIDAGDGGANVGIITSEIDPHGRG